ncbi:GMC oxidoreductase [Streptomyces indicus]|uniref:Cholesterol oxidase n=1 Tax=Streptomyces indicus TaxID=417292 RepID=A0A1G8TR65_9ACTN|nr:GMC oxidoreductase [Streptomyces indicus]SDJ44008.1 cholesterol oxidase [Streptomyces indicus]
MSPAPLRPYGRRELFGLAATGTLAGIAAATLPASDRAAAAVARRTRFPAVVIGSGFGGAVAALRLGRAGLDTLVLERGAETPGKDGGVEEHRESGLGMLAGAAVGGGSVGYFGVTLGPQRRYFERLYPKGLRYDELARTWFPLARRMLRATPLPRDVYASAPYTHVRSWDARMRRAGFATAAVEAAFNWQAVRDELAGRTRSVVTAGDPVGATTSGAKLTLRRTYLSEALATGRVQLRARAEVVRIQRDRRGYVLEVRRRAADGTVTGTEAITCELLFLAAGTLGTNRLLVAARETGALPDLPAAVGSGFGDNGDQFTGCIVPASDSGPTQGGPIASTARVHSGFGLPLTLECGHFPPTADRTLSVTFAMTVDTDHRGTFRYDPVTRTVRLTDWSPEKTAAARRAALAANTRIAEASPGCEPVPYTLSFLPTAHPVGGCEIGRVTDLEGRVRGMKGLYVVDGTLLPGNAAGANPSLTITALAERALAGIIRAGG